MMGQEKRKSLLATLLILILTTHVIAQDGASLIKKQLLWEELSILKANLEKAQPGLYNYTPKEEMDAFFENLKSAIDKDMSSIDFFRSIAPLSNKIRNGHTILVPSSKWEDHVINDLALLPFDLYFYDNKMYILRNLSDKTEIKEGAILKKINGKSALEIFNTMVDRWFKDGYNLTRPREIVEEEYRFLYAHFFGATPIYELEIQNPDQKEKTIKVKGIKEEEIGDRRKERYGKEYIPWWRRPPEPLSLQITDSTAHLKVTQFSNGVKSTQGKRFTPFIKNAFKTIKAHNVRNLVLDLRGNQGGDVKPQIELLRHLVKEPFHLYKEVYANIRKLPNPEYYEFNLLSRAEFNKNFVDQKVAGVYPMKNQLGFEENQQQPAPNLFNGKLYVLIDGWSFSATGEVCGILKEHRKDAVFVGEETGGNPVTNISGIQTFMTLPHSKNRILICLVSYTTDVSFKNDGHGTKPDFPVRNSILDMVEEKDAILEKVNQLILESKSVHK